MRLLVKFDGGCYRNGRPGARAYWGFVVYDRDDGRVLLRHHGKCLGPLHTCNVAEYDALLAALRWVCRQPDLERVVIEGDSRLVVRGVNKRMNGVRWPHHFEKAAHLNRMCEQAHELLSGLRAKFGWALRWVPREENEDAHGAAAKK